MKTEQQQKKIKKLLVYPLLVLPFVTLAFWALDGGKSTAQTAGQQQGLNHQLPQAHLPGGSLDKMSLYRKAESDSAALRQSRAMDPFNTGTADGLFFSIDTIAPSDSIYTGTAGLSQNNWKHAPDAQEQKVADRLKRLEEIMTAPSPAPATTPTQSYPAPNDNASLDRLEAMMQTMTTSSGEDQEMKQLGQMLESIKDIQNPGLVQQRLKEQSEKNRGRVYTVSRPIKERQASYLSNGKEPLQGRKVDSTGGVAIYEPLTERNGFYDLEEDTYSENGQTAIPAVIHETQTVISGSTLKMRLTQEVMVNGTLIPQGSFIYGNCAINGERLMISIPGLRSGKHLFPVALAAYSLDGLEGISIPGALTRDAAKEGMDRTVQSLNLMSMDPSIAAQAAGAGVEVAKGLFGKKAKLVRVTVKAGYPLLLMDAKAKQDLQ